MTSRLLPALSLALLLPCSLLAQAPAAPDGQSSTGRFPHIIAANDRDAPLVLDADRAYPAELLLLGFDIRFATEAQRDLWALAAGEFTVDGGNTRGDLRAAAKAVKLNGATVDGNLLAVANGVQIDSARVHGETLLRANRVYTDASSFAGDVLLYAPEIRLGGTFSGNVSCPVATALHILPGTRIEGTLSYPDALSPAVPADASIAALSPIPAPAAAATDLPSLLRFRLRAVAAFWLSFLLLGLPLFRFFPLRTAAALQTLRRRPFACLLAGFLATFSALPILTLLAVTVYALPLALCAATLLLCFSLAAIPLLALLLGQLFRARRDASAPVPAGFSSLALGLLALALPPALLGLPGLLMVLAAATLPFGALILTVFHPVVVLRPPHPVPPPPPVP